MNDRWRVALHEAGHLVADSILSGNFSVAVILDNGGAMVYTKNTPIVLCTFYQALITACGPAAESLADTYPAPADLVCGSPSPESAALVARAVTDFLLTPSDEMRLARWACESCPDQPKRWASRVYWVRYEADIFVRTHTQEIVAVAADLYARGIVFQRHERCQNMEVINMQAMVEVEQQQREQARERFVGAIWSGATPADLYEVAKGAGIPPAKADEFIREVGTLQALAAEADELPALNREAHKKAKAHGDLEARNRAEIERLERELEVSAAEADAARTAWHEAERAGRELLRAVDQGLVPPASLSKSMQALRERLGRQAKAAKRDAERVRLMNAISDRRRVVGELEYELRELPQSRYERAQRADHERRLEKAKAALTAAETELAELTRP